MKKLQKFEEFLKQVQTTYTDEFNDLSEIDTRYRRLSDTNALLQTRHNQSGGQTDALIGQMDAFKRESDVKTLSFTNRIAAEQRGLQDIEEQKAQLMIGNDEKTEQLLKKTSEHGTILMSIDSLYKKVAVKNEQNGMDTNFTQHKSGDVRDDAASGSMPVFTEKTCEDQLEVIKTYITSFERFRKELGSRVDDSDASVKKHNQKNLFQKMLQNLENDPAYADEVDDFRAFDPNAAGTR